MLAALAWIACLGWEVTQVGVGGVAVGLVGSGVLTAGVVAVILWLGRHQSLPRWLLFSTLAWGASFGALLSLLSQEALQALFDALAGTDFTRWFRPLVITPVTEELFKGIPLIWLLWTRRRMFTGLLDGVVIGALAGAGFSFTENVLYLGKTITAYLSSAGDATAIGVLAISLLLRVVMVPFMHPFLVAIFGLGVAAAARRGTWWPAAAGWAVAVVLHGLWDYAGLAAADPFLIYKIYGFAMVPLFVALAVLALRLRRRPAGCRRVEHGHGRRAVRR